MPLNLFEVLFIRMSSYTFIVTSVPTREQHLSAFLAPSQNVEKANAIESFYP